MTRKKSNASSVQPRKLARNVRTCALVIDYGAADGDGDADGDAEADGDDDADADGDADGDGDGRSSP